MKEGFNPLDRGYDDYYGTPESIDYGCTDTQMGAPDSGCLKWAIDRCPLNANESAHPWGPVDGSTCHPGPKNPWDYSIPLLHGRQVAEQPVDLDGSRTGVHLAAEDAMNARFSNMHKAFQFADLDGNGALSQ